ncbi:MAG: hypothetical protein R6V57_13425 [Vicinamibacterales bacterium]
MTITLVSSAWEASGRAWTPLDGTNAGGLIVVVEVATRSGRVLGQPVFGKEVEISYSDGAVIKFKSGTKPGKTNVTPKRVLQKTADPVLEYGQPAKGYITGVEVKDRSTSWKCAFGSRAMLSEIDIYPLPHALRRHQARGTGSVSGRAGASAPRRGRTPG